MKAYCREHAPIVSWSLPNTKLPKDPGQLFFVGDLAGDFAKIVEGAADIGGEKVAGKAFVESALDVGEGGGDALEGFLVTCIGDDGSLALVFALKYPVGKGLFQVFNSGSLPGRNKQRIPVGKLAFQLLGRE